MQFVPDKKAGKKVVWHVDTLLGSDHVTNNQTTAVTRQMTVNSNRENMFSVRSMPICFKQES
jgi:hypothetical protein